eukprot:1071812-Pelagomonas_calceolata.AAC.9
MVCCRQGSKPCSPAHAPQIRLSLVSLLPVCRRAVSIFKFRQSWVCCLPPRVVLSCRAADFWHGKISLAGRPGGNYASCCCGCNVEPACACLTSALCLAVHNLFASKQGEVCGPCAAGSSPPKLPFHSAVHGICTCKPLSVWRVCSPSSPTSPLLCTSLERWPEGPFAQPASAGHRGHALARMAAHLSRCHPPTSGECLHRAY